MYISRKKNVNVTVRVFFSRHRNETTTTSIAAFFWFVWLKIKHPEKQETTNGERKVFFMLLMKEAIVTVNIKIIICEMPSSFRNRQHSIIYSPPVPTNTFYCCCFHLFIFFVLLLSVSNFFCAPPFTTNHSCHSHFFFYLWMKQNIDFLMTSSSSFPQAFFYIFFSLLCYSFFYPPLQSLFFLWINTLFQESVNIQEKMMKKYTKKCSLW